MDHLTQYYSHYISAHLIFHDRQIAFLVQPTTIILHAHFQSILSFLVDPVSNQDGTFFAFQLFIALLHVAGRYPKNSIRWPSSFGYFGEII